MGELRIKQGVNISGLDTELCVKLWDIANVFWMNDLPCVVTSARRDPVGKFSYHHTGRALDFRANHITRDALRRKILTQIKDVCGQRYDVILHGDGDHIHYHVELDRKEQTP